MSLRVHSTCLDAYSVYRKYLFLEAVGLVVDILSMPHALLSMPHALLELYVGHRLSHGLLVLSINSDRSAMITPALKEESNITYIMIFYAFSIQFMQALWSGGKYKQNCQVTDTQALC